MMRWIFVALTLTMLDVVYAEQNPVMGTWLVHTQTDLGAEYYEYYTFGESGNFQLVVIEMRQQKKSIYQISGTWRRDGDRLFFEVSCSNHPRIVIGRKEVNTIVSLNPNEIITRGSDGRIAVATRTDNSHVIYDDC